MRIITAALLFLLTGSPTGLMSFRLSDQFGRMHSSDEYRGRVLLVLEGDRTGARSALGWWRAVRAAVADSPGSGRMLHVGVADLRDVPWFFRGFVRGRLPKDPDEEILLDWHGQFATNYHLERGRSNLLIVDPQGTIVARASGTQVDDADVQRLASAVRAALRASASLDTGGDRDARYGVTNAAGM